MSRGPGDAEGPTKGFDLRKHTEGAVGGGGHVGLRDVGKGWEAKEGGLAPFREDVVGAIDGHETERLQLPLVVELRRLDAIHDGKVEAAVGVACREWVTKVVHQLGRRHFLPEASDESRGWQAMQS